ncbi:MAG: 1-deoxy-D-xylulose-5-phosphate reductoisomerase, partial [Actinobacteria bacterium]|nr:1-deoxy-D-xylulose-5-phosphate reductoisomerase [Actinomycetota bacterium]
MKNIAVLGSTGSIGKQAFEVIQGLGDEISVVAMSAYKNGDLLANQVRTLGARKACLIDPYASNRYAPVFEELNVEFFAGARGLLEMVGSEKYDIVLNGISGSAGLPPTLEALKQETVLALANKESLVAGGDLVMKKVRNGKAALVPVDSEHSAIFQCLLGQERSSLRRIVLTASGGPFRTLPAESFESVTVKEALAHPTWSMGKKITIDSATLMNKGLEVLEAYHLFDVNIDDIHVVVHPQSVIHSMVEMVDGSVIAQMGVPDMRVPIQYSLTFPERASNPGSFLSLEKYGELTFEEVDRKKFKCLEIAYWAGREGKTYPAAMNAANEEAVAAFLSEKIRFTDIAGVVEGVLEGHEALNGDSLDE